MFSAFSGSPTVVHCASFSGFDAKAWQQSQTDLFTCTIILHCGHTFLRHIDLIYGITLWTCFSKPLVKDSHKSVSSTQYRMLQVRTWSQIIVMYVLRRGIWKHWTWRKWLTCLSRCKFITLLTFELSSLKENGFLFLLHIPRCSHWYLSLDA